MEWELLKSAKKNKGMALFFVYNFDKHWGFEDSRLILTSIVSRIWTFFRNQNQTIVAQMATILAILIHRQRKTYI
jgi:hypothetical protein